MSHKILNKDRPRTPVTFSDVSAIAATRFLDERAEAGLRNPTKDQVKRAQRLVEQNPMLRGRYANPLGLQMLALELPLSKHERRLNRRSKDEGGIELELRPVRRDSLGDQGVKIDPASIENWLRGMEELPSPEQATLMLAGQAGYSGNGLGHVLRRVDRWTNTAGNNPPCGHIREKARMLDAIATAIQLIPIIAAERAEAQQAEEAKNAD